jgi:hypothetical protein
MLRTTPFLMSAVEAMGEFHSLVTVLVEMSVLVDITMLVETDHRFYVLGAPLANEA